MNIGKKKLLAVLVVLLVLSFACSLPGMREEDSAISVEVSLPTEGEVYQLGDTVHIVASVFATNGISQVDFEINGQFVGSEMPEGEPENHVTNFAWTPVDAGEMALILTVFEAGGSELRSEPINFQVAEAMGENPDATQELPSDTQPVATDTVSPTNTDTPTDTPEPSSTPEPTNTPQPTDTPEPTNTPEVGLVVTLNPGFVLLPSVERVGVQVSVPANSTASAIADCPAESVLVSGGFATNRGVIIYTQSRKDNGWRAYASNQTNTSKLLNVYAVCATNISNASSQQVYEQINVPAGENGHVEVSCPWGGSVVTGGGWAAQSDGSLWVYNSSKKDNGWQIYARNTSGSEKLLNVYAQCLSSNSSLSSEMSWQNVAIGANDSAGQSGICDTGIAVGGGFALQDDLRVYNSALVNDSWTEWITYAYNIGGASRTMNAYAVCLQIN